MVGVILCTVAVLAGAFVLLWRGYVARGSDLQKIRQWADAQGYAVLHMRRSLSFWEIVSRAFACGLSPAPRGYEARVQDEEGGQFTVVIHI